MAEKSSAMWEVGLALRCEGARVGKGRPGLMAVAGGSRRSSSGWCGGGRGRKNYLSSESCLHGEGSVSSLARWSERQALWSGEWKPEARRSQEDTVRPWPRLSQGHSLCLLAQILAHSLVEFRVLPLAP